jgi:hypothetical protein
MAEFFNRQWRLPNNENKAKQSNYSMDFDSASSDYIDVGNDSSLSPTSQLSVSAWVNNTGAGAGSFPCIISNVSSSSNNGGFALVKNSNKWKFYLDTTGSSGWATAESNGTVVSNSWQHLCVTWDGSTVIMYLNGQAQTASASASQIVYNADTETIIGEYAASYFQGKIDTVAIYNYALSASQVTTLYGSSSTGIGNPMTLNPIAYYPLGDQDAFNGADYLVPNSSLKDYVFDFPIAEQSVDVSNNFENYTEISLSTWVNFNNFSGYQYVFSTAAPNNGAGTLLSIAKYSGSGEIYSYDGFNLNRTGVSVALNTWNHILVTQTGTTRKVFINGQQAGSNMTTSALNLNQGTAFIGKYHTTGYSANAKISNVQIFNTALPATGSNSVETLYNNGSPLTSMSGFTSLQGWWKLNASATYDSSTTTWTIEDSSSNSNDGTSSGMTQANLVQSDLSFTSGYSPYALDFDKASFNSITINADLSSYSSITVSTWAKFVSSTGFQYIFDAGTYNASGPAGIKLSISKHTNNEIATYDGLTNQLTGVNVALNTWYHITVTHAGTTRKVYLNGSLIATFASGNLNLNAINYIGRFSLNTNFMDGSISNVSIWNTALTSTQVTEIYSEGIPQNLLNHSAVSSLVSWWQLGSNSSFNNTVWTVLDEIGTNDGVSSTNMSEVDIVNGVGYSSNGVSSGMSDNLKGDAPYSTANSLSVNMDVLDRTTDIPS